MAPQRRHRHSRHDGGAHGVEQKRPDSTGMEWPQTPLQPQQQANREAGQGEREPRRRGGRGRDEPAERQEQERVSA